MRKVKRLQRSHEVQVAAAADLANGTQLGDLCRLYALMICATSRESSLAVCNSNEAFSTIEGPRTVLPSHSCSLQSIRVFRIVLWLEHEQDGRSDAGTVEFVERLILAFAHPCHPLHLSMQPPFQCRNGAGQYLWRDGADHFCVSINVHRTGCASLLEDLGRDLMSFRLILPKRAASRPSSAVNDLHVLRYLTPDLHCHSLEILRPSLKSRIQFYRLERVCRRACAASRSHAA